MFNLRHAQCAPPCMHCMWIYVICVHIDVTTFHVWITTICTENLKVWPTVSLRSLSFKSRSNWLAAHVSIFFKLSQGDQMCGQIWAMSPKNQKLRKIWPTIRSWANLAKYWCRQIRQLVKQAPPGLFNTKSTWLLDNKHVHKKKKRGRGGAKHIP